MNREDKLREELEDAWFALVMEKVMQQEGAELHALNEQLKNDPKYAVPEDVRRRSLETIRKLETQERRRKRVRSTMRTAAKVACVAAVASAMLVSTYAVLPSARKTAILEFFSENKGESTRLLMEDANRIGKNAASTPKIEPKVMMGYQIPELPKGFIIVDEWEGTNAARIKYSDDAGKTIRFRFARNVSNAVEVDTEEADDIPIQINGMDGSLYIKGTAVKIAWNDVNTNTMIIVACEGLNENYVKDLAGKIKFMP